MYTNATGSGLCTACGQAFYQHAQSGDCPEYTEGGVPVPVARAVETILKSWFDNASIKLDPFYLNGSWTLHLTTPHGELTHIQVEGLDEKGVHILGHTLYLASEAFVRLHRAYFHAGMEEALSRLARSQHDAVFPPQR